MLDTAVDGIIVINEQARVLVFNKACEYLFGYSAAEMLGRNINTIMPSEYAVGHDQYLANYIRTGVRKIIGIGREVKGQHKDGTVFPIELSVGEAATPEGRQFIGIIRDVRARKEAEQRLVQLQSDLLRMARVSAMDEMGAALAHELNQPLTALMLYLQSVARASKKEPHHATFSKQAATILEKAMHEAERAGSIIQRMRHFIERRDPIRRFVDLNPLVEDAVELTLLGSPPGIRISRTLADDLPQVLVDPVQIQQVIVNLVRNALEAIKHDGTPEVAVATLRADDRVLVRVRDNSRGNRTESFQGLLVLEGPRHRARTRYFPLHCPKPRRRFERRPRRQRSRRLFHIVCTDAASWRGRAARREPGGCGYAGGRGQA